MEKESPCQRLWTARNRVVRLTSVVLERTTSYNAKRAHERLEALAVELAGEVWDEVMVDAEMRRGGP